MSAITLDQIRSAADRLAVAHQATVARVALMQEEIKQAVQPIYDRHRAGLDAATEEEAAANRAVWDLLTVSPQLFKRPRSLTVNGVRAGWRKAEDSLDWDEDHTLIDRIAALIPEQYPLLVRTEQSIVADAVAQLDGDTLRTLGVRRITGADAPYITMGDADVEKLAKALIADALRRQGEDDAPKAKKGKAKLKAGVA